MPTLHSHTSFFFNDTATTEIYTLSLHDALPILSLVSKTTHTYTHTHRHTHTQTRSEEHTSELQSHLNLVCRLLLERTTHTRHRALPAPHTCLPATRTHMRTHT